MNLKPGMGKAKGSAFERNTGYKLSMWLTENKREDLFSRNVGSGSRFTLATQKGKELAYPGDLMAAHEEAFQFLRLFCVECKHYADLKLESYFYDFNHIRKSFLGKVIEQADTQASSVNAHYMIVAKQNRAPTLCFVPLHIGVQARLVARPKRALRYHRLHNDTVMVFPFELLLEHVNPKDFLAIVTPKVGE